jgi:acetamidase/formamidase
MAQQTVFVNTFTNGIVGPSAKMVGPVVDGGFIVAQTAAGCWGPMITPELHGGHEVTSPVLVENAEIGDAIAIRLVSMDITSEVTTSGNDIIDPEKCVGDPYVAGKCPHCGTVNPPTETIGIGENSVVCKKCKQPCSPFTFSNGYTIAFDSSKTIGITLDEEASKKTASNAKQYMHTPDNSIQNPAVVMQAHDIPGVVARMRPFVGQLGTVPPVDRPDSHNAGDFGAFLVNAPHEFGIQDYDDLQVTDGHMDIARVRQGAIVIAPVRVKGGGVYVGDMHAMQGDGEIAGHTTDVCGIVTMQVTVLKGLNIEGPIILPVPEDLPYLAKPLSRKEKALAQAESAKWNVPVEDSAPLAFVGTGKDLNHAVQVALSRAGKLLGMSVPEVMNRCTITGNIEIGRAPGVVTATFRVPVDKLKELGLYEMVAEQYLK